MSSERIVVVKGDKILEKEGGKVVGERDYSRVLGGYRATVNSSRTSSDAKAHAREMIKELTASHAKSIGVEEGEEPPKKRKKTSPKKKKKNKEAEG